MSKLRPNLHFTPRRGWMNDPNGPVFFQGEYHLFFQHDPDALKWGLMHWGHAKSKDLLRWEELPIALFPDEQGAVFSGSAFVDYENAGGFGTKEEPALLLFYTSHNMETGREMQCLAYSPDGVSFQKYAGNPVIPGKDHTPARDPQVFRNTVLGGYSLCLTVENAVEFYHSDDFIHWEKTGEFLLPEYALHGMIECPCMFRDGKYVLMLSMDVPESEFVKFPEGTVPHHRVMQFFTGEFDGSVFVPDRDQKEVLLVDSGEDFYAGTIFSNIDKIILIAWLGDFSKAAGDVKTEAEGFRGIMSYPRKLSLKSTERGYRLMQEFFLKPVAGEGVLYRITDSGEELTDGCVKEIISKDGLTTTTSIFNPDEEA